MIKITELNKDLAQYFIDELVSIRLSYTEGGVDISTLSVRITKLLSKLVDHEEIVDKDTLLGLAQEVMTYKPDLLYVFDQLLDLSDKLSKALEEYNTSVDTDTTHTHPWLSKDKGKPKKVYETITKFRRMIESGDEYDLESTEVALMLSSIITHVLLDIMIL